MDVQQMYSDFRYQYPEIAETTDAKHLEIWGNVEHDTNALWFESLAGVLNDRMGIPEHRTEIAAIFNYTDKKFCTGSKLVKNCIDVCFVENLFWQVAPNSAAPLWALLPKVLQQLHIDFHGQPPNVLTRG